MKKMTVMLVMAAVASTAIAMDLTQGWTTTMDLTYTCKYMWRGFNILDDAGAFQPSFDFAHESGLGANLWMSYPERGGSTSMISSRVNLTEYNYTLYYSGKALEGNCWETNYTVGWRYYDYIDTSTKDADVQEVFLEAEMPMVTGTAVIPHVALYQMWPSKGGGLNSNYAGTIYLVGFSYLLPTEEQMPDVPLTFSWDIVYNDGTGGAVDSDLSHMVWGLQSEFDCPMTGGKFVPAVYFQNSFEDTVNPSDEFWGTISYRYTF